MLYNIGQNTNDMDNTTTQTLCIGLQLMIILEESLFVFACILSLIIENAHHELPESNMMY